MTRYCPNGDGAFDDDLQTCPQCGARLQAEPPAPIATDLDGRDDAPIVWLANAANEVEAMMWAGVIREQQIPVLLRPGGPGAGAWASSATFEHGLYVREPDLPAAQAILDSLVIAPFPLARRQRRQAPRINRRTLRRAG